MTEASAPALQPEPAEYVQIWADSFSQVMGQIKGCAVTGVVRSESPPDLPAGDEGDLRAVVTASGGLRGEMTLRLAPASVLQLAQIFMSEPSAPEAPPTTDHRDAVIELLRQVSGIVSSSAKARWGELQLRVELAAVAASWTPAAAFWLQTGEEGPRRMTLELGLSAALVAELRAEKAEAAAIKATPVSTPPVSSAADSGRGTGALERLMEVQLALTLRFGSRQLLLREVLDLGPGAVVELDRRVEDPVDLLLDGKLVARGEVVVIDGSYGLRVTDVTLLDPRGGP